MSAKTIVPKTRNIQRVGLAQDLFRIVTVDLFAGTSFGDKPLHLAHGVRFNGKGPASWYVTHADAQRFGWVS